MERFDTEPPAMISPMLPLWSLSECVLMPRILLGNRMPPSSPFAALWSESVSRPFGPRFVTMSPNTSPVMSRLVFAPTEMPVIAPWSNQTIACPEITFTSVTAFALIEVSPVAGLPAPPRRFAPLMSSAGAMRCSSGSMVRGKRRGWFMACSW